MVRESTSLWSPPISLPSWCLLCSLRAQPPALYPFRGGLEGWAADRSLLYHHTVWGKW